MPRPGWPLVGASAIHKILLVPSWDSAGPLKSTFRLVQLSGRSTGNSELVEIVASQRMTWPLVVKSFTYTKSSFDTSRRHGLNVSPAHGYPPVLTPPSSA